MIGRMLGRSLLCRRVRRAAFILQNLRNAGKKKLYREASDKEDVISSPRLRTGRGLYQ